MKGMLVIDGMSIAHAANCSKPLSVGDQPTQAVFGFLRSLRASAHQFPMLTPIVLWDGVSWRNNFYADYKISRNKDPETKYEIQQAELKSQLKPQRAFIRQGLEHLGVRQISAFNLEADDLAAILVRKNAGQRRTLLVSGDKDWIQLIGPKVGWFDPIRNNSITPATLEAKLGVKTPQAWLECKALMGDNSDDIPGVGGIGEKGAKELLNTFGSMADFFNRSIDGTLPKLPKKFMDLATDPAKHDIYLRNLKLMDLNSPHIPAPVNMVVSKGKTPDLEAFHELCAELQFNTITRDIHSWCAPFCAPETLAEAA